MKLPEEGSSDVGKSSRKIASVRSEVSVGVQIWVSSIFSGDEDGEEEEERASKIKKDKTVYYFNGIIIILFFFEIKFC